MRPPILWLSMAHPGGRMAGSSTYSAGLLRAAAATGAAVTLLTYGEGCGLPGVRILTAPARLRGRWRSLSNALPASAWALASAEMAALLRRMLAGQAWAAAVVDHGAMGWAAPLIQAAGVPMVYVSHNHEGTARLAVARAARPAWRRPLLRWDAAKFARLEATLVRQAALVTAITAADAGAYRSQKPRGPVLELPPGYAGGLKMLPPLSEETPRRVILVGRYDWIAKQENLARWAADGVPLLAAGGVETAVAGHVPPALQQRLARPGLRFLGEQPDLAASLAGGRIGLVAEALGGGFKMKTLDYIFHGLPIAALPGGLEGLSAGIRTNAITAETPAGLAAAILEAIDDLPRLERMRRAAFAEGRAGFDWRDRGEMLGSAIVEHCLRRPMEAG